MGKSFWIQYEDSWYNLQDFCHLWIEEQKHFNTKEIEGYYLMGEWKHSKEEVVLSPSFKEKEYIESFLNTLFGI